jgi:hypothetical protein
MNRPQEASDELLDTRLETGADRDAEPDVQQAAQAEDEAEVLEEWETQGAYSDEPDPDKFTDPWDESYNPVIIMKTSRTKARSTGCKTQRN